MIPLSYLCRYYIIAFLYFQLFAVINSTSMTGKKENLLFFLLSLTLGRGCFPEQDFWVTKYRQFKALATQLLRAPQKDRTESLGLQLSAQFPCPSGALCLLLGQLVQQVPVREVTSGPETQRGKGASFVEGTTRLLPVSLFRKLSSRVPFSVKLL